MPFASKTNTQMLSNRSRPTFLYAFRGSKGCLQEGTDRRKMRDANEREMEFAAYIRIDWAEQKHACALQSSTASGVEESELMHKPEAVEAWATELYRRFGGRPIAIALEQSRGSLLFMLLKYEHLVLFPVNPSTLVNYLLIAVKKSSQQSEEISSGALRSKSVLPFRWSIVPAPRVDQ